MNGATAPSWRYDVALSFAGEDRAYVEKVARALLRENIRCFYDADEEVALWGKHLTEELADIYTRQAATVVVFVSDHYARGDWTRFERRAALTQAVRERREYILPVRFDDTPVPGLLSDLVAVRAAGRTPEQLADLIRLKLTSLGIVAGQAVAPVPAPLVVPAATSVPEQIPREVDHFTGRSDELGLLDRTATAGTDALRPPVCLITGMPSVGKTALAVHWARGQRQAFPDGQLYVNLNGFGAGRPLDPGRILRDFLLALGVGAARIPQSLDARAALYLAVTADQRLLVVLDNAASYQQVAPLLPESRRSMVVVTSRLRLSSLVVNEEAARLDLAPFGTGTSLAFLEKIVGPRRLAAEADSAAELAERAGGLPLALRAYGTLLAARPELTFHSVIEELSAIPSLDWLDQEEGESIGARESFEWSYRGLRPEAQRLLCVLGLHPGPEVSAAAVAATAVADPVESRRLLRQLTAGSLLGDGGKGRYRLHDLLRSFAEEKARAEMSRDELSSTEDRMAAWYLHTANEADSLIAPQRRRISLDHIERPDGTIRFSSREEAIDWCDSELANISDVAERVASRDEHDVAWRFGVVLWNYFYLRKSFDEWVQLSRLGVQAAQSLGDPHALFESLNGLASAYRHQHRLVEAAEHYRSALVLRGGIGGWNEAWLLNNLAETLRGLGEHDEALDLYGEAIRITESDGDTWSRGCFLTNLGEAYAQLGRYEQAIDSYRSALPLRREHDHLYGEGWTYNDLGEAFQGLGRLEEAVAAYDQSLELRRRVNDRYGEAWTLHNVATVVARRDTASALPAFRAALDLRRAVGDRWGVARTADSLAEILGSTGDTEAARVLWREALDIYGEVDADRAEVVRRLLEALPD